MSDYDVIVIGSGAGGGTLARHLAPSGKRILLLERGGWLPREPQNWRAEDVFVDGRYVSPDTWYYATLTPFAPQVHYYVGGATKLLRRRAVPAAGGGLRRAQAPRRDLAGVADLLRGDGAVLHAGRAALPGARRARARTRPSRRRAPPIRSRRSAHEPRIQQLSDDLAKAGLHPFHAPCGILLDECNMPYSKCVRCDNCDGFPCLVHAKSDAEVISVRPALEHPNVTLLTGAEAVRLTTQRRRDRRHRSWSSTRRRERDVRRRHSWSSPAAPPTAPSCCSPPRTTQHPHGLANGSDQVGRNYMFHNSQAVLALSKEENPTIFQKTLGVNDFYFSGGEDFEFPLGNIQMVGKSQAPMFRGEKPGETRFAPTWSLEEVARHAVDFWLSTEDLPLAREPGHARPRRQHRDRLQGQQRRAQGPPVPTSSRTCSGTSACTTGTCCRITPTSRTRSRSPAAPTRPARAGSAPTPPAPCSTPTARRTSSTTCTSSTRASSRASARSTRRSPRWRTPCGSATTCSSGWAHDRRSRSPPMP